MAGCSTQGTSQAGFTSDEDAYQAHGTAGMVDEQPVATSVASGTDIFHPTGTVYGATHFSEENSNLEIVTPGLNDRLAVNKVKSSRTDNNLLSVSAALKNDSGRDLPLQVETLYRDKDGRSLNDGHAGWVPLTLKPHEQTEYRSVSITDNASDFLVRIRRASAESP